jgi:ketosteroid isomerase-like protein
MKTTFVTLMTVLLLFGTSCQKKIDKAKEEAAIKAVIEEEKSAFMERDFERMAATWIHSPSSTKIYMAKEGQKSFFGWDKIREMDKEGWTKDSSDRKKITLDFSDYQFNIYNECAWILCKATWSWNANSKPNTVKQNRILAFEKQDGKWKYTLMAIYNIPIEKDTVN